MKPGMLAFLFLIPVPTTAQAEVPVYHFDKVHSQIHASVDHLGYSRSTARFQIADGSFRFDPEKLSESSVEVTLAVASMDLGDATWKQHLVAPKWFDAEAFPEIRFVSTRVADLGDGRFRIDGELTLKGKTAPVSLDARVNRHDTHPFYKRPHAGFSATGKLLRSAFGLTEGIPMVSDEVDLRIEIEGSVPAAP